MTLKEVARYLSVHPNTIYRLAKQGKIPAFKVGSDWRFNTQVEADTKRRTLRSHVNDCPGPQLLQMDCDA